MKLGVWAEPSKLVKGAGSVRWTDPETGLRQRCHYSNRDEKMREMTRIQSMLLNYKKGNGNPDAIPLVIMENYLSTIANLGRRHSTIDMKRRNLIPYLESVFKMSQITNDSIKAHIQTMQTKYKIDTVAIRLRDLRAFLNWCVKEHVLGMSPFQGIQIPRSEFVGRRITLDEIKTIRIHLSGPFEAFIMLAFDTGARHGELLAAEWSEIDLDRGYWFIPKHKCKTRVNRTIPLSDHVVEGLKSLPRASNRVFEGLNRWKIQRHWKAVLRKAGIKDRVRVHDIRHTFASNWQGRAASLKAVAGWVTDAMMSKYTHTELSFLKEEAARTSQTIWAQFGSNHQKSETEHIAKRNDKS